MRAQNCTHSIRVAMSAERTLRFALAIVLSLLMSFAYPAAATETEATVVANPGQVVLTLDYLDVRYETAPSNGAFAVGFRFDVQAPPECSDGLNNDDHSGFEQGVQDALVDYPADPECASAADDSEDKADVQERVSVVLVGTVDANGRLEFPAEGVSVPPRYNRSAEHALGGDGVVINTFEASETVVGQIDPRRGTMTLDLKLRLRFEVEDTGKLRGPGSECYLGSQDEPQRLVLIGDGRSGTTGIHPARERGYYPTDGAFVLAGTNAEQVVGASCCGLLCFGDGAVERAFGVPAERGAMTVAAIGHIDPPLVAPKAGSGKVKPGTAAVAREVHLEPNVDPLAHLGNVRDDTDETAALLQSGEGGDR